MSVRFGCMQNKIINSSVLVNRAKSTLSISTGHQLIFKGSALLLWQLSKAPPCFLKAIEELYPILAFIVICLNLMHFLSLRMQLETCGD